MNILYTERRFSIIKMKASAVMKFPLFESRALQYLIKPYVRGKTKMAAINPAPSDGFNYYICRTKLNEKCIEDWSIVGKRMSFDSGASRPSSAAVPERRCHFPGKIRRFNAESCGKIEEPANACWSFCWVFCQANIPLAICQRLCRYSLSLH